jgi:glycosyltransferase involved in cell wall biosynthesis
MLPFCSALFRQYFNGAEPSDDIVFYHAVKDYMTNSISDPPRVLLLAYACQPDAGSEPGIGWNRALQLARHFQVVVLCNEHENRKKIEQFLQEHGPLANLQFVFVPASRWQQALRGCPGMFYMAYHLWHRQAFKIAQELHARWRFDLVHQLTYGTFREPGYLWKLDAPFFWGPTGGVQNYPWRFIPHAGWRGALTESLRSVLNVCQLRWSKRIKHAAQQAALVLASNEISAQALAALRGGKVSVLSDTGFTGRESIPERNFQHGGPLRLLWSGVFEHRKALHLLLEALSKLPANVPYELRILGRGPLEKRWRRIAVRLGIEQNCRWLGWIDHDQAIAQFSWADLFVFTSLRDSCGTVVLEALGAGTPVVCFDHQGGGEIVTSQCGLKLPVSTPTDATRRLGEIFTHCHNHRAELQCRSRGAIERAKHYTWDNQGQRMAAWYRDVLGLAEPTVESSIELDGSGRLADVVAVGNFREDT